MAVNETIVTGRYFRKLIDAANKQWQRFSFWTKASDVEFDDGKTAEKKLGLINGITDSLDISNSNFALSARAGNELKRCLGGLSFTVMTQREYEEMKSHDSNTIYFIIKDIDED